MAQLKILQVIDVFDDARNGAVISTRRFVDAMKDKGHDVCVLTTGKKERDSIILPEFYPPFPFVKNVMQQMKMRFAFPEERKLVHAIQQCDVVHIQFPFWLSQKCIEIAQLYNKPIVSTFHVQAEQIAYNLNIKSKWIIRKINRYFVENIYNKSSCVICPSEFAQEELNANGLKTQSIVISNGIMPEYFIEHNALIDTQFKILTVGRNAPEKRQQMLIDAVSKCRHKNKIVVEIIGEGPLRDKLQKAAQRKLPDQVKFFSLPKEKMIQQYIKAHLYVHCAEVEVESMSTMEAMACGLPMLIADAPLSAAKQFALNRHFLFKDAEELSGKIDDFIEHKNKLLVASKDYKIKANDYRFDKSAALLEQVYYSVV